MLKYNQAKSMIYFYSLCSCWTREKRGIQRNGGRKGDIKIEGKRWGQIGQGETMRQWMKGGGGEIGK